MNQLNSINRIASLLSRFVVEVKGLNAINQYGINYLSETVLIPLFKEIFGYTDLVNLNSESQNFAGIDIGDRKNRVAFQITSNSNLEKVKHTLQQFGDNKHYEAFDTLFIYCITEKIKISASNNFNETINGNFKFSVEESILDYKDLLRRINAITDYDKILRIENLLAKQFSEIKLEQHKEQFDSPVLEMVFTNLLKISFPDKLYTARIDVKRKDIQNKKARIFNDREMIYQYKKENELRFSGDWIDFGKQLYSFHNLSNPNHDMSKIIDLGTVETITPGEFYEQSKDHERAFKALLKFCLSKHANFIGIEFRHVENLFVFKCEDENGIARRESWNSGKRSATRDVIKIKLNKKTNGVWYYTHLAFSVAFKHYQDEWYLEISPDWFVTQDGYVRHTLRDKEVTSWLKRRERNQHVLNNTRFIANYLKFGKRQTDLFNEETKRPKNFIEFHRYASFTNSPFLNEDDWKTKESAEFLDLMTDQSGTTETEV